MYPPQSGYFVFLIFLPLISFSHVVSWAVFCNIKLNNSDGNSDGQTLVGILVICLH